MNIHTTFKVTFNIFYITYWSMCLSIEIYINKFYNKPKTQPLEIFLTTVSLVLKSFLHACSMPETTAPPEIPQLCHG